MTFSNGAHSINLPSGEKWILSSDGLFRLNEAEGIFEEISSSEIPKDDFTNTSYLCWGKRNEGIYYFDPESQNLIHIPDHQAKWPSAIMPDGRNSFWFSSFTSKGVALGISLVAFIPGYFTNTLIISPDSSSPAVYSVIMDKDRNIWIGIRGYDHIVQFKPDGSVSGKDYLDSEILSYSGHIRSMIPVENGIWIGYFSKLLQFFNYNTGKFTEHNAEARGYRAMTVDANGNLYIGTNNLSRYYPASGKTETLFSNDAPDAMFKLYADTSGIVWAGMSESRLIRFNTFTGKGSIIKVTPGVTNVEDIIPGDDGDLWLALLGMGVCRYNTIKGTFKYYTTSKGLSNNTTYSLLRDKNGRIWVSTNDGISMIDPESDHIMAFDETDGIAISEFNSGAKYKTDDGEFFFGGMGGFIRFRPDSMSLAMTNVSRQRLLLTNLEVSGDTRHVQGGLNESDTIVLARGENNFHLSFSSTDFVNSGRTIFRYMTLASQQELD